MMRRWVLFLISAVGMTLLMTMVSTDDSDTRGSLWTGEPMLSLENQSSEQPHVQVELTAVVSVKEASFAELQRLTGDFEKIHPNVSVKLANYSREELYEELNSHPEKGDKPDIPLYPASWIRYEAAKGHLLSLDNHIPLERQSQWFDAIRDAVRWNGYLWGVPLYWDPYVFVFEDPKKQLGGQKPPNVSEWLAQSNHLSPEAANYSGQLLLNWKEHQGRSIAGTMDLAALEGRNEDDDDAIKQLEALLAEQVPWALVPLSKAVQFVKAKPDAELAAAPFVPDEGVKTGYLPPFAGSSFVILPNAEHPELAAEWIRYITDMEHAEEFLMAEGGVPVYRSKYGLSPLLANEARQTFFLMDTAPEIRRKAGEELWPQLKPMMQMIEEIPLMYGTPPKETPAWAAN